MIVLEEDMGNVCFYCSLKFGGTTVGFITLQQPNVQLIGSLAGNHSNLPVRKLLLWPAGCYYPAEPEVPELMEFIQEPDVAYRWWDAISDLTVRTIIH